MQPAGRPQASVDVQPWSSRQFASRVEDAMVIYVRAMGYPQHTGAQRAVTARRHTRNEGFACRAALAEDSTLIGFGYGYTTLPGQWWHDLVRRAMTAEMATEWLTDSFELSELHVLPEYQGHGIGRQLLEQLTASIPQEAVLLSTPDADTRAFRMYRSLGFIDLARHYLFPGDGRPFAVLGARLPLLTRSTPGG
jgi:ribosomal protein S18 acetylase RimI-like enzyme